MKKLSLNAVQLATVFTVASRLWVRAVTAVEEGKKVGYDSLGHTSWRHYPAPNDPMVTLAKKLGFSRPSDLAGTGELQGAEWFLSAFKNKLARVKFDADEIAREVGSSERAQKAFRRLITLVASGDLDREKLREWDFGSLVK